MPQLKSTSICLLVSSLVAGLSYAQEPITSLPPSAMVFETSSEGVGFATLNGDRFQEAYMAMVQLPAGLVSPAHIKSADMFGVMISGKMVHTTTNGTIEDEIRLPEGSYYHIPAGVPHVSKCVSEVDCVTFLYQNGKFDFQPVTE